jgi:hypothetical protein
MGTACSRRSSLQAAAAAAAAIAATQLPQAKQVSSQVKLQVAWRLAQVRLRRKLRADVLPAAHDGHCPC